MGLTIVSARKFATTMERTIPKRVIEEKMIKVSLLISAKAVNLVMRRIPMAEENNVVMKMTAKNPFINWDFSVFQGLKLPAIPGHPGKVISLIVPLGPQGNCGARSSQFNDTIIVFCQINPNFCICRITI
jgi:hypothetical protein